MNTRFKLIDLPVIAGYTWRTARREDACAIHRLVMAADAADQRGMAQSIQEIRRTFDEPGTDFTKDSLVALTQQGEIAALGWVFSPERGANDYRAFLWGVIHPDHRGRGLGSAVLEWMEARGQQVLSSRPQDLPHCLALHVLEHESGYRALLESYGFYPARYFLRMRRSLDLPVPQASLPAGLNLRTWSPELDRGILRAFDEAFRDHWGFIPLDDEAWKFFFIDQTDFRPDLTFAVTQTGSQGVEQVVAFSINQVRSAENAASGIREGWIQDLGVRRAWRKQGIATALLCASMRAFQAEDLQYIGLGVDSENQSGALRIYERLGFTPIQRQISYRKDI